MATPITTPAVFPVWKTVAQAFQLAIANWRNVIRITWAWIPILLAAGFVYGLNVPTETDPPGIGFAASLPVFLVVSFFGFGSIAVAWHRLVLLGEHPNWVNLYIAST